MIRQESVRAIFFFENREDSTEYLYSDIIAIDPNHGLLNTFISEHGFDIAFYYEYDKIPLIGGYYYWSGDAIYDDGCYFYRENSENDFCTNGEFRLATAEDFEYFKLDINDYKE